MNPENFQKGFYYHYKHDPKDLNNYAYEVIGVGMHTEDRTYTVIYRPLYKNTFLEGADYCIRPRDMFFEQVTKEGKTFDRFQKITDEKIINVLKEISVEMYKN